MVLPSPTIFLFPPFPPVKKKPYSKLPPPKDGNFFYSENIGGILFSGEFFEKNSL